MLSVPVYVKIGKTIQEEDSLLILPYQVISSETHLVRVKKNVQDGYEVCFYIAPLKHVHCVFPQVK